MGVKIEEDPSWPEGPLCPAQPVVVADEENFCGNDPENLKPSNIIDIDWQLIEPLAMTAIIVLLKIMCIMICVDNDNKQTKN